jgi:hypothetical protein
MRTMIVTGTVTGGQGCAVSLTLMHGEEVTDRKVHNSSFVDSHSVNSSDGYTLILHGTTSGTLHFAIEGEGITTDPSTPRDYQGDILDDYGITT